jgi:transposase
VLVTKIIDIERFSTPEKLVGYFGIFPEENSSGVDKEGHQIPPGKLQMSRKGDDLVRHYLWNAALAATVHNPPIRAHYHRLKAKGTRGKVAIGHCMRKLLHMVFVVWKTNRPFTDRNTPCGESPAPSSNPG